MSPTTRSRTTLLVCLTVCALLSSLLSGCIKSSGIRKLFFPEQPWVVIQDMTEGVPDHRIDRASQVLDLGKVRLIKTAATPVEIYPNSPLGAYGETVQLAVEVAYLPGVDAVRYEVLYQWPTSPTNPDTYPGSPDTTAPEISLLLGPATTDLPRNITVRIQIRDREKAEDEDIVEAGRVTAYFVVSP